MRTTLTWLAGACLLLDVVVAAAQSVEPVRGEPRYAVQRTAFAAALSQEPDQAAVRAVPKAPQVNVPMQPDDPAPPRWGALDQPLESWDAPPAVNYLLAGPQRSIFQRDQGQGYERFVEEPYSTVYDAQMFNQPITLQRPDALAPAGVMGDHTLKSGGNYLFSYRYRIENYNGNLGGTHGVSEAQIAAQFPFVPLNMTRERHLFLMEYAPVDDLTLMAQLPIYHSVINYQTVGGSFRDQNTQLGDITLSGMYVLRQWNRQQIHLNFGVSVPAGLIDVQGNPPDMTSPRLSYPIRTSTGTFDLIPGLTYRGESDHWSWGTQSLVTAHLGRNRYDYRVGDQVEVTSWVAAKLTECWSVSTRLDALFWGDIHGRDIRLDPTMSPTLDPALQGGQRVDLLFGTHYVLPLSDRFDHRLGIEGGLPVYQCLRGPQLQNRYTITGSWNVMF